MPTKTFTPHDIENINKITDKFNNWVYTPELEETLTRNLAMLDGLAAENNWQIDDDVAQKIVMTITCILAGLAREYQFTPDDAMFKQYCAVTVALLFKDSDAVVKDLL